MFVHYHSKCLYFFQTISPLLNSIQNYDKQPGLHKAASTPIETRNERPFGSWSTIHPLQQTTFAPPTTQPSHFSAFNQFDSSPSSFAGGSDLKTSSSQDSRRTQNENVFESNDKPTTQKTTPKPLVIEFRPPFLYPIYNTNHTSTVATTTSSPQFVRPASTISTPAFSQTTVNSFVGTRQSGSSEERTRSRPSSLASSSVSNFGDRLQPASSTEATITSPPQSNGNLVPVINEDNKPKEPPTVLLPPYETLNLYNGASTQGPPIYYEWKLPASDLEPPFDENKSNGAITISDENQIPVIPPQTTQSTGASFLDKDLVPPLFVSSNSNVNNVKLPTLSLKPPAYSPIPIFNDTIPPTSNHTFPSFNALPNPNPFAPSTDKSQTQRSIATTPSANTISTKRQSETTTRKELNYLELKKHFSIPEYTFPLENIERPSYTENNAVNSFQIKIPDEVAQSQEVLSSDGSSNEVQRKPWYGENAKCPECHPSFLKPNSCEPCIKIR